MDFEHADYGDAVPAPNGAGDTRSANDTRHAGKMFPTVYDPDLTDCATNSFCVLDCIEPLGPCDHFLVVRPSLKPGAARFARLIDPALPISAAQGCLSDAIGTPALRQALMSVTALRSMTESEALGIADNVALALRSHPLIPNGVDVAVYTVPSTPDAVAKLRSDLVRCPKGWQLS
jgi:hypothetical protein